MAVPSDAIVEVRDELIVSPSDDPRSPSLRTAHFLKPSTENPNHSLSPPPPPPSEPSQSLSVSFNGWLFPQSGWREWVERLVPKHREAWERAGILEPILNSTYRIFKAPDLIVEVAKKWRPETNTFVFGFAEATVSLEDVMVAGGYSLLGCPVFEAASVGPTGAARRLEEERLVLVRTRAKKASHNAWMGHFMGGAGLGRDVEHEAFLALWLSRFVFPGGARDSVLKGLFPLAVRLARGVRFALGPAVLAGIYRDLTLLRRKLFGKKDGDCGILGGGGGGGEIALWSPFQLVLVWVWERFLLVQPKRNLIFPGEPRQALWHEVKRDVESENPRVFDLDSGGDKYFLWRPYTARAANPALRRIYGERGEWRSVGTGWDGTFESFARCLRPSELVGVDPSGRLFIEQYLPHRVARQFGFDQDLSGDIVRRNEGGLVAWESYNKSIGRGEVYFPSRLFTPGVTLRYLEWWERSKRGAGEDGGAKSVARDVKIISVRSDRRRSKKENGSSSRAPENFAQDHGNARGGGYVPKAKFEKVVLSRGTKSTNVEFGLERLREKNNGELLCSTLNALKEYGNIQGGRSVANLTMEQVFGPNLHKNKGIVGGEKKRMSEENNGNARAYKGFGLEDKVRLERVSISLDIDEASVINEKVEFSKKNCFGFDMSRLQDNGIVLRDENVDTSCPPGFSQKHGTKRGVQIIDLEDNLVAPKKMPKSVLERIDHGRVIITGVELGEENDSSPPPGFNRKYGHNNVTKGANFGLKDRSKTPKMISLEGKRFGEASSSKRLASPLGFWQNQADAIGSEASAEALFDMAQSEDACESLIENEASSVDGLRLLGVEMIRACDDHMEEKSESEVLIYMAETGKFHDVDDLDGGKGLETHENLVCSRSRARVDGKRAMYIPDLNK